MLTVDSSQVATAEHSIVIGNMTRPPYWSVQIPSASQLSDPVLTGLSLTGLSLTGLSLTGLRAWKANGLRDKRGRLQRDKRYQTIETTEWRE